MSSGLSSFVAILFFTNVAFTSAAAQPIPHSFVIEGRLYNQTDGSPLSDTNTTVMLEVVTESAPTCVLYRETHANIDFSNATDPTATGVFALELGTGVAAPLAKPSFVTLFSAGTFTGVGGCSVTANPGEHRYVRIGISNVLNSYTYEYFPLAMITSVPTAVVAQNASTLQGYGTSAFIMSNTDVSQSHLDNIFSTTNYSKLTNLLNGTSTTYMPSIPTAAVDFNSQRLINVATPATGAAGLNNAVNRTYADSTVAGQAVNPSLATLIGPGTGAGSVMSWDAAANRWTASLPVDATKLPLAGGTMTGAIDMGNSALKLGRVNNAQEAVLVATLPIGTPGASWYNTDTGTYKIWNGTIAVEQANLVSGKLNASWIPSTAVTAGTYGSSTLIPVVTVGADGRVTAAYGTSFTGGGASGPAGGDLTGTYPNPTLAANSVTTAKINDDAITAAKIKSSGIAVNRLIATDPFAPSNLTYFECGVYDEILAWTPGGWGCKTVNALAPLKTVANKSPDGSGNISLNTLDINGLGLAATKNFGTAAGELVELDGSARIPAGVLPVGIGTITQVTATAPLMGGGTTGSVTISIDTGTAANQVVRLNGSAQLPDVDGSLLVNVNATNIGTRKVATTAPSPAQVLAWNGSQWEPTAASGGSVASVTSGMGLVPGVITANGTINIDVGSTSGKIVQVSGSGKLDPIDGSQLFNVNASNIGTRIVSSSAPGLSQVLGWNGSQWEPMSTATGSVTNVTAGAGLVPGVITSAGTISVDVGSTANKIVQVNGVGQLDPIDGGQLFNLNASKLGTRPVATTTPGASQVLGWSGSQWEPVNAATGTVTGVAAGIGMIPGTVSTNGTLNIDVGSGANKIVQVNGVGKLDPIDGSLLFNLNASTIGTRKIASASPGLNQILAWNGSQWEPTTPSGVSWPLSAPTSSVGAPAYTFAGDLNTGMYNPAADSLALVTGGAPRITVNANGFVGIGNASPASPLDVNWNFTANSGNYDGAKSEVFVTPSVSLSGGVTALRGYTEYDSSTSSVSADIRGVEAEAGLDSTGLLGNATGISGLVFASSGGTISNASAGYFTTYTSGANITNAYGVNIGSVQGTNKWSLYASDATAPSYFAASVGIGTATPGSAALDVVGNTANNSAIIIPRSTTLLRPAGANGMIRYNINLNKFEAFENGVWTTMIGSAGVTFPLAASPAIATAATPSYSFAGDTQTGIYSTAAGSIALSAAGVGRLFLNSAGKAGIGKPNPAALLDVYGTIGNPSGYGMRIDSVINQTGTSGYTGLIVNSTESSVGSGGTYNLELQKDGVTNFSVTNYGAVTASGFRLDSLAGTTYSPNGSTSQPNAGVIAEFLNGVSGLNGALVSHQFQVLNASGRVQNAYLGVTSVSGTVDSPDMVFGRSLTSSTYAESMRLTGTGKLGIGTSSPGSVALEIVGTGANNSAILIPRNTTALRPAGANGMIRYNTNLNKFEAFENGNWVSMIFGGVTFPLLASPGTTSAATPSYTFAGDSDTGLFSTGAGTTAFATNGTTRMTIDSLGNLGIGTAVPNGRLVVASNIDSDTAGMMVAENSNSGTTASTGLTLRNNIGDMGYFWTSSSNYANGGGAYQNRIMVSATGYSNGLSLVAEGPTGDIRLIAGGTTASYERMRIDGSGNVGIGTQNPGAALDVQGLGSKSAIIVPRDSGFSRPTPIEGMIRYNTTTSTFEGYSGGAWKDFTSSADAASTYLALSGGAITGNTSFDQMVSIGGVLALVNGTNINMNGGSVVNAGGITGNGALTVQAGGTNQNLTLQASGTGYVIVSNGSGFRVQVTTDSSSPTTGATTISGGLGVAKSMFVGGNLTAGTVTAGTSTFSPAYYGTGASSSGLLVIDSNTSATKGTIMVAPTGGTIRLAEAGTAALVIGQYGSTTTLIAPNGTGRVAIGTMNPGSVILSLYNTASTQLLDLYGSSTSATGVNQAKSTFLIRQSSTLTGQYSGYDSVVDIWTANPSPAVVANGLSGSVKVSGTTATSGRAHGVMGTAQTNVGTGVQDLAGVYGSAGNLVMGYTQNMSGVRGDVGLLAAATYGTAAAIRGYLTSGTGASAAIAAAGLFEASGSFTNSPAVYGVYIGDMPVAGSSSFGIFQSGADDKNYFAGKVGIGASPGSVALEIYGTGINHSAILIPRDTTALRPAGTNGMLRYNSNTNKFEGFENGTWKDVIQSPRNTISQFEEFMSVPIGAAAATTVVGTALFTSSAGVTLGSVSPASSLEPGIARMTATTTPGNAALAMCGIASAGAVIPNIYLSASPWIFEARVRFSAVNATLSQVRVGMVSASNQYTDNMLSGVFFENQVGTTSAITMAANGSSAQVGSSAAITVSTWYTYKIVWDGSTYSYFSNGNPVTGPTGGSAPAMGTAMCPGVFIVSTGTPSARNVDVDYISFTHQVPGR